MRFTVLTIFPGLLSSYFDDSILKIAKDKKLIEIDFLDIRKFSLDKHKKVDDSPYGGGSGMVMTCQPIFDAIKHAKSYNKGPVVHFTPRGIRLTQKRVERLHKSNSELILLCGRYEGIDQRVIDAYVDLEISVGDFVLTGGELPAAILIDAISRLIDGVLGDANSHAEESFSKLLKRKKEYPHYTKPADYNGMKVPDVLLSGNHAKIHEWRMKLTK